MKISEIQRLGMTQSHARLLSVVANPNMIAEEWSKGFISIESAVAALGEHGMTEFDAVRFLFYFPSH